MSLIDQTIGYDKQEKTYTDPVSSYAPTEEEKEIRGMIIRHFTLGDIILKKPRREFNDLSIWERSAIDEMAFNTYQPNDGDALEGDEANSWRSRAVRPVVRNKAISIAAHATARLLFPKLFAFDKDSETQEDAATTMSDLIEWSSERPGSDDYPLTSLQAVVTALHQPASIIYHEYAEVYRNVKRAKNKKSPEDDESDEDEEEEQTGKKSRWEIEKLLDEDLSGFGTTIVSCQQLFIENFYEKDLQKQGYLLWRRVQGYDLVKEKFGHYENFKYVKPGVQILYNDANQAFYETYDQNMRQHEAEVVLYWNKALDLFSIIVNGVMLTEFDAPNPRHDKLYPFEKFGYHPIGNGNCFYYKSLAFEMGPDEKIVNSLYPMIIDGTYLNIMPPMVNVGGEEIGADVIVPGKTTTLSDPNADLRAIRLSENIKQGMDTLFKVEENINNTSASSELQQGNSEAGTQTAYEISKQEQNASTVLGLFITMIGSHVKQYARLRIGDIVQYITIAEVDKIIDNSELVYKVFMMPEKQGVRGKSRKIIFDPEMPTEKITEEEHMDASYKILHEQGGLSGKHEIYKVNPALFRDLKYLVVASPDVLSPMSEDVERAFSLEQFDRMIQAPQIFDPEKTGKLLLEAYPRTRKHPDSYLAKPQMPANPMQPNQPAANPISKLPIQTPRGNRAGVNPMAR